MTLYRPLHGYRFPLFLDAASSFVPADTLNVTMFILMHWAETKRAYDFKNPGSQGDGSFFGITTDFKGKEVGYPGTCCFMGHLEKYLCLPACSIFLQHALTA